MTTLLTILFDGIAYGMLLFVLACGLAVTLGLMNFVNLAHGAFAMAGGYITAVLMNRFGVPFLATLPAAVIGPALIGVVLERNPDQRRSDNSGRQRRQERHAEAVHQDRGDVTACHSERAMREVNEIHEAKGYGEPACQHEQQHAIGDTIEED